MRCALPAMACLLAACSPVVVESPRGPDVSLVIKVDGSVPERSRVTIDDQVLGPLDWVAAHGVRVRAGSHRMTVTAPGYLPFDRAFEATGKRVVVDVSLRQSPE
jgi:hypothetical protein